MTEAKEQRIDLLTKFSRPFLEALERIKENVPDWNWMKVAGGVTAVSFLATVGVAFLTGQLNEQGNPLVLASGAATIGLTLFTTWMGYNTIKYFN